MGASWPSQGVPGRPQGGPELPGGMFFQLYKSGLFYRPDFLVPRGFLGLSLGASWPFSGEPGGPQVGSVLPPSLFFQLYKSGMFYTTEFCFLGGHGGSLGSLWAVGLLWGS